MVRAALLAVAAYVAVVCPLGVAAEEHATAVSALDEIAHYGWYHIADPHGLLKQHHIALAVDAEIRPEAKEKVQGVIVVVERMTLLSDPAVVGPKGLTTAAEFAKEVQKAIASPAAAATYELRAPNAETFVFVLSVFDRNVKLVCNGIADARVDYIMDNARYYLHEGDYEDAVARVLIGAYDALKPGRARPHDLLFFLATLAVFSTAAYLVLPVYPQVWGGLLLAHLLFNHWLILAATVGASVVATMQKPPPPPPPPKEKEPYNPYGKPYATMA